MKRELDFLVSNWTSSKMTFTVNIHTNKTIIEHNFDRYFAHVSKSGKLFCIFPFHQYLKFPGWETLEPLFAVKTTTTLELPIFVLFLITRNAIRIW